MRRQDAWLCRVTTILMLLALATLSGCSKPNVELKRQGLTRAEVNLVLNNVEPQLPPITGKERPLQRAGSPAEPLQIGPGGRAVLVHCLAEEVPAAMEEEWHRAHVIVLDSLSEGTFEVTPASGRLIETTQWRPARQPYVGLEGTIKILSVSGNSVLADCAVRNVIGRSGDPVYPLRGLYKFYFATGDELALSRCAIHVSGLGTGQPTSAEE